MKYSLVTFLAFLAATSSVDVVYGNHVEASVTTEDRPTSTYTSVSNVVHTPVSTVIYIYRPVDGPSKPVPDVPSKPVFKSVENGWAQAETNCDRPPNVSHKNYRKYVHMSHDRKTCKKHCIGMYKSEFPGGNARPAVSTDGATCEFPK